jgi:uncharacterized membrane protein
MLTGARAWCVVGIEEERLPLPIIHGSQLFGGAILLQVSAQTFWAYFAGGALSVTGLAAIRREVLLTRGSDKLISMGRLFFAVPMAVFGTEHFTAAKFIVQMVPAWMPWPWFWLYFVGLALIAGALSISVKRMVWLSAPLMALMLFCFVTMIGVPNIVAQPRNRELWEVGLRDSSFSAGALALAGMQADKWGATARKIFINVARNVIAVVTLAFGVLQILRPAGVPGVPLGRLTPVWVPGAVFWTYLAGVVSLVTGACLLVNRKTRAAATALGAMVLLLVIFVYLPILGASLNDINDGLNYFVDTLTFSGAALLLADAMPKEETIYV